MPKSDTYNRGYREGKDGIQPGHGPILGDTIDQLHGVSMEKLERGRRDGYERYKENQKKGK